MSLIYQSLLDAVGCTVTVETLSGYSYTGKLESVDKAGMGVRLSTVLVTQPNGMKDAAISISVPGTEQKFIKLPSAMKFAPRFQEVRSGGLLASSSGGGGSKKNRKSGAAGAAARGAGKKGKNQKKGGGAPGGKKAQSSGGDKKKAKKA